MSYTLSIQPPGRPSADPSVNRFGYTSHEAMANVYCFISAIYQQAYPAMQAHPKSTFLCTLTVGPFLRGITLPSSSAGDKQAALMNAEAAFNEISSDAYRNEFLCFC